MGNESQPGTIQINWKQNDEEDYKLQLYLIHSQLLSNNPPPPLQLYIHQVWEAIKNKICA